MSGWSGTTPPQILAAVKWLACEPVGDTRSAVAASIIGVGGTAAST
jgi:hypothetical protein